MYFARIGQSAHPFSGPVARANEVVGAPITFVSLEDYKDKWLVFFWYPADFTFVCPTEIISLSDRYAEFREVGAEILAASTDSVHAHRVWLSTPREANGIQNVQFPILSDQTHRIARSYGVLVEEQGIALRGTFIIDPNGVMQYASFHNLNVGRSVEETLRVLHGLQAGGVCSSDWKPSR